MEAQAPVAIKKRDNCQDIASAMTNWSETDVWANIIIKAVVEVMTSGRRFILRKSGPRIIPELIPRVPAQTPAKSPNAPNAIHVFVLH